MRFVQYFLRGNPNKIYVGVRDGADIIPVNQVPGLENGCLKKLLEGGSDDLVSKIQKHLSNNANVSKLASDSVELHSPITRPDKVLCVGLNYKDHCEETNMPIPVEPVIFNKFPSSIAGPYDDIPFPEVTQELDYEVELAFVIGKYCRNVSKEDALNHVFGYTAANDVSARDWQLRKNGGQWLLGKTMDAFCPLGPELVTADEVGDPQQLNVKCILNGQVVQNSNTSQMVHSVAAVVSFVSKFFPLLPGDVVLTGTPPGVGFMRKPPLLLKPGDIVECEVEKIGKTRNTIR